MDKKNEQQHVRQFDPSKPDPASFITTIPPNTLKQCSMRSICIVLFVFSINPIRVFPNVVVKPAI